MNFVEPYPQTRVLSGKPLQLRRYCAVIIRKQVSTASLSMSFKALPREMPLCARYRHMFQKKGYYLPEKLSRRTSPLGLEGSNGHALSGVRVDGPSGRRFLRGLSLTRLWREGCCRAPLNYRRRPLMKKPLQPHLLKRVPPACKGERTMRRRGGPPIGGQDSDRVSNRCSAPYTLLPLRGISPQGETRK